MSMTERQLNSVIRQGILGYGGSEIRRDGYQ